LVVILAQRLAQRPKRLDPCSGGIYRPSSGDLLHQPIHKLQLAQSRPALVPPPPARARGQPDRERLRKILVGVALGVPVVQVQHVLTAVRLGLVVRRVRPRGWTERLPPARLSAEPVGMIDRMIRLLTQDLHAARPPPAL